MEHEQREIEASDGTRLHVETWTPAGDVRFVVVLVHGGAEHVTRYGRLARDLGEHGGLCFGPDHRGQGRSGGRAGHVDAFETYASDLRQVILRQAEALPASQRPDAVPWFIFGHSMGGLISLTYLLEHSDAIPLRGVILSAPLLGLTMKVNPLKLALGKVAGTLMPKLSLPSGIPPEAISRDAEEVRRYRSDPHRVQVVSAGWFAAMNRAIARVEKEAGRIDVPLLWYVGTGDLICDHQASLRVFESLPDRDARDQSLEVFDGYYHELHNEPTEQRAKVIELVTSWIEQRIERPAQAT